MLPLFIIAVLTGILTTFVIRRTTDVRAALRDGKRMQAHLLEFRLFFDEPSLIWRAQLDLLRDNARLLRLLLLPTVILALPMTWLFLQLDAIYGLRALRPGDAAIVTAQLTRPIETTDRFDVQGAAGIAIETPPVRAFQDNQIAFRIRPARDGSGAVDLKVNGRVIRKTVVAGEWLKFLSHRRSRSLAQFLLHPEEPRLPDGEVEWVEVNYPATSVEWAIWYYAISAATAVISGVRPSGLLPGFRPAPGT